ncbi:hypothetical protein [Chromobacterium haemolyticum]|uniref:hypothetical protein n=1 Tax=Chromobacterium haemolyticum TaxID=394935 RepID=UPI0009D9941D|nr:hypothetical protein [Chromobacterium haemolyticum]OQS39048.1 hypothetical protein B0T40_04480 [Chromobacterium haemolyticum]PTU68816.1 hypothetical protein DBB33_04865 [Chromobacterium haemolyticum]UGA40363.1 hypothetical protein JOS77_14170 [Chromobacterium haemolyticum]
MNISVDFWYLVGLLLGFLGFAFACGRLLLSQIDRRITETIKTLADAEKNTSDRLAGLERDLQNLRADLPTRFVMREDYVRGQSVIEARLDSLYIRIDDIWKRGSSNGR